MKLFKSALRKRLEAKIRTLELEKINAIVKSKSFDTKDSKDIVRAIFRREELERDIDLLKSML